MVQQIQLAQRIGFEEGRFVDPSFLNTTNDVVFTVDKNFETTEVLIHLLNNSAFARDVDVWIVPPGQSPIDGNQVIATGTGGTSLQPGESRDYFRKWRIPEKYQIYMNCDAGTAVVRFLSVTLRKIR